MIARLCKRWLANGRVLSGLTFVGLIGIWEVAVWAFDVQRVLLPAPTDIVARMVEKHQLLFTQLQYTVLGIFGGYAASVVFALALSILMTRYTVLERMIMPLFIASQSVPKIAVAPLILLWAGVGTESKILVVVSMAFFPILINTMAGFKSVDPQLIEVFRSVNASERQMFLRLRFPYALPYIFAGLRIATTLSVIGAIVAEWLASSDGLGYILLNASFNFDAALSFAAITALAVIGMSFFGFISLIESMFSWGKHRGGVANDNGAAKP